MLLSASAAISPLQSNPLGYQAVSPNTPVMPFATPAKKASFIDPTVVDQERQFDCDRAIKSSSDHTPRSTARGGAIKIGNGSDVLDNASIVANAGRPPSGHRSPDRQFGRDRFWGQHHRAKHHWFIRGFKQAGFDRCNAVIDAPRSSPARSSRRWHAWARA